MLRPVKIPFGKINLTNSDVLYARTSAQYYDVLVSCFRPSEIRGLDIDSLNSKTNFKFHDVGDFASLYNDKDVAFFQMMQTLYDEVPKIANGEYGTDVLLHCYAGVSRSSALTLWLMAHCEPEMSADDLFYYLKMHINPYADPNPAFLNWISEFDDRTVATKNFHTLANRNYE